MSRTQSNHSDSPRAVNRTRKVSGVTITPDDLTTREIETAEALVLDGEIRPVGIGPLSQLFIELGLASEGFLGCVLAPLGEPVITFSGITRRYRKTVPVWAVEASSVVRKSRAGCSIRSVTYLDTREFVSWLKRRSRETNPGRQLLPAIPESSGGTMVPSAASALPSVRVTPATLPSQAGMMRGAIPLPSSTGGRTVPSPTTAGPRSAGPPPSYVSQLGDVNASINNPLSRAEGDFRAVPRINGGREFDPDEYTTRLSALNIARANHGLPSVAGVTPSTYQR